MKIRNDFVTNSSSSSFIICFARINDMDKAQKVLDKHNLTALDVKGVNYEKHWTGRLGADWCGAIIYGVDDILSENPGSKYIVIEDSNEADYDEDYEPVYDYDFTMNDATSEITEENGFTDIQGLMKKL